MRLLPASKPLRLVGAILIVVSALATIPGHDEIGLTMWPLEVGFFVLAIAIVLGSARTGRWFTWSGSFALSNSEVATAVCGVALLIGWVLGAMFAAARSHL